MEALQYLDRDSVTVSSRLLLPHLPVNLIDPNAETRFVTEQFIANRFKRTYQAELKHFFPYILVAQRDANILATIGFQSGSMQNKMFVEHYFTQPVETEITKLTGTSTSRVKIVEVGNLAGNPGGASLTLFVVLVSLLERAGYEWLVFTATYRLRKMLAKLGVSWLPMAVASENKLPTCHQHWGNYYQNDPQVLAANISQVSHLIRQFKVVPFLLASYEGVIQRYEAGLS